MKDYFYLFVFFVSVVLLLTLFIYIKKAINMRNNYILSQGIITECGKKYTRRQVHELNKEQLGAIFENMSDSIYVMSKDGKFIFVNGAANKFINYLKADKMEDLLSTMSCFRDDETPYSSKELPVNRILRGEKIEAERMKVILDENVKYYIVSGSPIYKKDKVDGENPEIVVMSVREITEIVEKENIISKQKEKLLRSEMEKNEALQKIIKKNATIAQLTDLNQLKDKLLTIVTHDIRNPIATVISLLNILEDEGEIYQNDTKEIIQSISGQVRNTYNIVENLLEWLKNQKQGMIFEPQILVLSTLVASVIDYYHLNASMKKISIQNTISSCVKVFADKNMLEIILRNLISNAIKFSYFNGLIEIKAHIVNDKVIVSVKDDGIGIHKEKVNHIFNESPVNSVFGTAGERGIGLGLTICKEFVNRNGGDIWVESIFNKGSVFSFSLFMRENQ